MSIQKTNSPSSIQEIEAFNRKQGIKRDFIIVIVALTALGVAIALGHFYHLPPSGQFAMAGGIFMTACLIRYITKNRPINHFVPLTSPPKNASEEAKNFWVKLNAFNLQIYKKEFDAKAGSEIIKEFFKNKDELGDLFGDFLFKLMNHNSPELQQILSRLTNEEKVALARFSSEKNPVATYQNLALFQLQDLSVLKETLGDYFELETLVVNFANQKATFGAVLERVQEITKIRPIPPRLLKALKKVMAQKIPSLGSKGILDWVHQINEHPSSITKDLIVRIHQSVHSIFPKISEYFQCKDNRLLMTGAGFDHIIRQYKTDSSVKISPTTSFSDLNQRLRDFCNQSTVQKAAFPVNFITDLTTHFSTLYVEKTEDNQLRIFISDSLGSEKGVNIKMALENLPIKEIYFLGPQRQFSDSECSIFTLNDIIEISKLDGTLFDLLEKEKDKEKSQCGETPLFKVNTPPPGLMKMSQSLSKVDAYIKTKGKTAIESPQFAVLNHNSQDLSAFVTEVSTFDNVKGKPKKQSQYVQWGMARSYEMLFQHAITK